MSERGHFTQYDEETTIRCERALVTLMGNLGPWRERIYLVGGLAPRYLIGRLPQEAPAHIGTVDVDLVVGLALGDATAETYWTLKNNLKKSGFHQQTPSFRWSRDVEGVKVFVEFLCETDEVASGAIFQPKGEATGSGFAAFNVRGANLVQLDSVGVEIEEDRLDGGGRSRVTVRVANLVPFVVLKILSFQDRHQNKDAYDLVFTLLNYSDGPRTAGQMASQSPIANHLQVREALTLLSERFADTTQDGAIAYASFLASSDDDEAVARLRREAVATIREFLTGFGEHY